MDEKKTPIGSDIPEDIRVYSPGGDPKIVAIGGGHGLSTMLRGLKHYSRDITAIVTMADDGGSSGMLRQELGILPPGDARDCVLALSNTAQVMEKLVNYRFAEGSLSGQNFGNLFLAALMGITGSFSQAVKSMGEVLDITGRVLPVTEEDIRLQAQFNDGSTVLGESMIFYEKRGTDKVISRVNLLPLHPDPFPEAIEAIRRADLILIGPGSLYTSIIPNFLVNGVTEAVARSKAYKLAILNIMTQDGETEGYTAADHVEAFLRHSQRDILDGLLMNHAPVPEHLQEEYRREGAEVLKIDRDRLETYGIELFERSLLSNTSELARHDPGLLASAIMDIYRSRVKTKRNRKNG